VVNEHYGFLTLKEVIEIQRNHDLFQADGENMLENLVKKFEKNGNVAVIDLRLGSEVFLSNKNVPTKLTTADEYVAIRPGEFALLTTYEEVNLPDNLLAFISMRFQYKQKGLINVSGFHVDPYYKGRIIYSVYNAGPNRIVLRYKDEIFMIIFARLAEKAGKLKEGFKHITPDQISALGGAPTSLHSLDQRIRTLENWIKVLGWVVAGLIAAVLAKLFGSG
jgi:dCTP deaminase